MITCITQACIFLLEIQQNFNKDNREYFATLTPEEQIFYSFVKRIK